MISHKMKKKSNFVDTVETKNMSLSFEMDFENGFDSADDNAGARYVFGNHSSVNHFHTTDAFC
jgi:hypothetical protein